MIKRLLIVLVVVASPFIIALLFTYDVIKVEWVSFMGIQPSHQAQHEPLPMPKDSVPIQGAAYIAGLGAPVNPIPADDASVQRGKVLYNADCALCHGTDGQGKGPFAVYLIKVKPANLLQGDPKTGSDGALFMTITNGVDGAMPPLRENLNVQERWDVVNYVRAFP
jgi:mono/diheme cytochrome c family protein